MAYLDKLLCYYFSCKFKNVEILGMLAKYNKCNESVHIKKILRKAKFKKTFITWVREQRFGT